MKLETEGNLDHRTFVYRNNTQNARETFIDASPRRRCVTRQRKSSMRRNSMLSRGDGKRAVLRQCPAAQKRIPCNRLVAVDRIYSNKGITLLLLDEPLTIPFEMPRRYPYVTVRWCHPQLRVA